MEKTKQPKKWLWYFIIAAVVIAAGILIWMNKNKLMPSAATSEVAYGPHWRIVPNGDVVSQWLVNPPVGSGKHYTTVDEPATPNDSDYISTFYSSPTETFNFTDKNIFARPTRNVTVYIRAKCDNNYPTCVVAVTRITPSVQTKYLAFYTSDDFTTRSLSFPGPYTQNDINNFMISLRKSDFGGIKISQIYADISPSISSPSPS